MIAIESEKGELVKVLQNVADGEFGFHRTFGFISKARSLERKTARKRQGYDYTNDEWYCSFKIKHQKDGLAVAPVQDCEAQLVDGAWRLKTPMGLFRLGGTEASNISDLLIDEEDKNNWLSKVGEIFLVVLILLLPLLSLLRTAPEVTPVSEEIMEPITVKIMKQVKTVNIQQEVNPNIQIKPTTQADKSQRAVQRNLGFLGMVGSQDLKKVVGGVPQELKAAAAGAGAGGDAGSGGEVLTGLGKGLKKTTVGNTGVQGLGGIGTKGAGGGQGGYGSGLVASGEGSGISAIAVSSSDMVLEGGIGRYAINATIAKYLNQVRRCYEAELKSKPDLQGLVEMSFQINASGMLNYSNVSKSTLNNKPVESCISDKMMKWQFPKPKGGVNVNVKYPFMLRPVG